MDGGLQVGIERTTPWRVTANGLKVPRHDR
jgi:hypothetical protein